MKEKLELSDVLNGVYCNDGKGQRFIRVCCFKYRLEVQKPSKCVNESAQVIINELFKMRYEQSSQKENAQR